MIFCRKQYNNINYKLKGDALTKYIFKNYPYDAINSTFAEKILRL
jgi:hypothetical protein